MNLDSQKNHMVRVEKDNFLSKILKVFLVKDKVNAITFDDSIEDKELIESIKSARKEWLCANSNFEYADQEIIDYYTYKIKACQVRYEYLIRKAKEKGIKVELIELPDALFYGNEMSN